MTHDPDCMIHEHQPPGADGWHDCTCKVLNPTHDPLLEPVAQQFRMAYQHGICDPDNCDHCDCNLDDVLREMIHTQSDRLAQEVIAKVRTDTLAKARELITALACPITIAEGHCEECEQYREALACIDFLSNEIASKEKKPRELRAKWKPLKKGGFKMRWKFKKAKND